MKIVVQKSHKGDWFNWYVFSEVRMIRQNECYCFAHGRAKDKATAEQRAIEKSKNITEWK